MDIRHLRYFIAIVDNDFNISRASQHLYISQPALSMMVSEFERREEVQLFKRSQGKLIGLTTVGEIYYADAKDILQKHNEMNKKLHNVTRDISGNISIGIPPLILSVIFSDIMPKLILNNPNIDFILKEEGAFVLRNELLLDNIHMAVLLNPTRISNNVIDATEIHSSELSVFLSPEHPLATQSLISWQDLHKQKIAIFDETFMIHHQLIEAFEYHHIYPHIILKSKSWDFLLNSAKINKDILTILPYPIAKQYASNEFVCRKIKNPIPWKVILCRLKKNNYSHAEDYIFDSLLKVFE